MSVGPTKTFTLDAKEITFLQTVLIYFRENYESPNSIQDFELLQNVLAILEGNPEQFPSI